MEGEYLFPGPTGFHHLEQAPSEEHPENHRNVIKLEQGSMSVPW